MLINLLLVLPLVFSIFFANLKPQEGQCYGLKKLAALASILVFALSCFIVFGYNKALGGFQFVYKISWIKSLGLSYHIGIDGMSALMLILTTFLTFVCILSTWNSVISRVKTFLSLFFLMEFCVIGVFISLDVVMFYVFFEAVLIPMFLLIGIWGGKDRIYSAFKFFIYTFFGSVLFLVAILYIVVKFNTGDLTQLSLLTKTLPPIVQQVLWIAFFASFAIKVPMFPFHTWLPDAHVQAPTAGSIMLAGILIKMGGYGFIRFSVPLLPAASIFFADFMIILSIIAIFYGSIIAIKQPDIKKMIAYSSVAHMGYVTMSIFTFTQNGINAAIFQMISHGLISGGLFLSVGVLYDRLHTRMFSDYGGIVEKMPKFALYLMILTMGSVGLPATSGFVGEFMGILSVFKVSPIYAALAGCGVVFGAVYMLFLYRNTMFGTITNASINYINDLEWNEKLNLVLLCVLVLAIGIFPRFVTDFLVNFTVV